MRFRAVLTVVVLISAAPLVAACNGGGGVGDSGFTLQLAPPVNFNPSAGLTPDLTDARLLSAGGTPFRP